LFFPFLLFINPVSPLQIIIMLPLTWLLLSWLDDSAIASYEDLVKVGGVNEEE
jgi:hypothetical protein